MAPITEAIDNTTGMVEKKIWIPEVGCVYICIVSHTFGTANTVTIFIFAGLLCILDLW